MVFLPEVREFITRHTAYNKHLDAKMVTRTPARGAVPGVWPGGGFWGHRLTVRRFFDAVSFVSASSSELARRPFEPMRSVEMPASSHLRLSSPGGHLARASRSARHPRHSLASGALRNTSACSRPVGPARTLPSASVGLCQEGRMHQEKTVAGWRNGFGVWWDVIVGRG